MNNPDDDRIDLYEPSNSNHCTSHEFNIGMIKTVDQKLNWCLGGLFVLLAAMGYLLMVQIDQGKNAATTMAQIITNTAAIRTLEISDAKIQEEVNSLFRWRERWEARESFDHGLKGEENHHVKVMP
jgi:hypothetical protein